jgi:pimeloyl-ACP methyl ester carboxylesterase
MPIRNVLYLHGFASSPSSAKAALLGDRLAPFGIALRAPDFNEPDFATLTVTRMLEQTARELARLPAGPTALIGSSLGGFVAVHAAARRDPEFGAERQASGQDPQASAPVVFLLLLAPAFEFGRNRIRQLGPGGVDRWKTTDRLEVFHHAHGETREVHYELYVDAQRYDAFSLKLEVPTVIIYGTRDESVEPASIERWARGRLNVRLVPVDDGHQLTNSLDVIWQETAKALGLDT